MIKFLEVKRAYYADPENVVVRGRGINSISNWCIFTQEPSWIDNWVYEIVPRTIRIGGIDVPEPVREALKVGTEYFIADISGSDLYGRTTWRDDIIDVRWLKAGLVHLTREAAIEHAKALILVSGGKV